MIDRCACGSSNYSKYFSGGGNEEFSILLCKNCGLKRTFPKPLLVENINDYYLNASDSSDRIDRIDLWRKFSSKSLSKIRKFMLNGKHLDVGCSNGVFVRSALDMGFDSFGIDLSLPAVELGVKELALKDRLSTGLLSDKKYPDNHFDILTYIHVMEHIEKINDEMREAWRVLKSDGILYIEVPRLNSIWRKLTPKTWYGYSAHEHIWQFDEKSLVKIIENNGFTVRAVFKRSSMHHQLNLSVAGAVKVIVHVFAFLFSLGDNLAVVAVKDAKK